MGIIEAVLAWLAANPTTLATIVGAIVYGVRLASKWQGQKDKLALAEEVWTETDRYRRALDILAQGIEEAARATKGATADPKAVKRIVAEMATADTDVAEPIDAAKRRAEANVLGRAGAAPPEGLDAFAERLVGKAGPLRMLTPFVK